MELTVERFDLNEEVRKPNTDRSTPQGVAIPTDFYFVVDAETEEVIEPIALFLLEKFTRPRCFRGGAWTKATSAEAAANDLKNWWSFINAHQSVASWTSVSDRVLRQYVQSLAKMPSDKTGDFLDAKSIRRYCASIESFHQFASVKWPTHSFPRMADAFKLIGSAGGAVDHGSDEQPRPVSKRNMRTISALLGPRPSEASADETSRTRLAWMIAHQTGLRIDEIVNLQSELFAALDISGKPEMSTIVLTVSKTKGLKSRDVFFPVWLLSEIKHYIAGEREQSRLRGSASLRDLAPTNLLLNRPDAPAGNAGKMATADTIENDFSAAVAKAGLLKPRERQSQTSGANFVQVPMHTFHDGRHTYAHVTFSGLLSQGMSLDGAWLLLRNRLGHKHLKTTIDTYLRAFSEIPGNTADRLAEYLAELEDLQRP